MSARRLAALLMGDNHFISVSKQGVLMARRKGRAPIRVADSKSGFTLTPSQEAVTRGVPSPLQIFFAHGGGNRQLFVTDVVAEGASSSVQVFQERFAVSDDELGQWVRRAVEAALDAA